MGVFKECSPGNKNSSSPLKVREIEEQEIPWLNCELLSLLKTKTEAYKNDGKADRYPLRTAGALPWCVEMQLEKQNLSSNQNCPETSKTTRKGFSGT